MNWVKFEGQRLELGDLLWIRGGLVAFVDTSVVTGEPNAIHGVLPSNWYGEIDVNRRSFGKEGYGHVKKSGWVYRPKEFGGDRVHKIDYVLRLSSPDGGAIPRSSHYSYYRDQEAEQP